MSTVVAGSVGAAVVSSTYTSTSAPAAAQSARKPKPLMKLGSGGGGTEEGLAFLARHSATHTNAGPPRTIPGVGWDLDDARRKFDLCAKYGITYEACHLPLGSGEYYTEVRRGATPDKNLPGISEIPMPNIMLGRSPGRDREIEQLQQMITVAGKTGIRVLHYNATILPVLRIRTEAVDVDERTVDPKRGNATYSTWDYEEAVRRGWDKELTLAGVVDVDEMYARITYLLDRIVPVAEENRIKLACHIPDPPVAAGYRGITRWNSPDIVAGIKRFAQLYTSPAHGFNFCVGSVAEGLKNPKEEIHPILRWVGERKQIHNVHLRNIKGGWNRFQEVYPDNGDMNFVHVMRTLRDVGYDGMIQPDHLPYHTDDPGSRQGFAFALGYIRALIQTMEDEAELT
jgi:mannonate dehydratase